MKLTHRAGGLLLPALLAVASAVQAQTPPEWADFAPEAASEPSKGAVPRAEWARLTQSATGLGLREPSAAERRWLDDARAGRWTEVLAALKEGKVEPNVRGEYDHAAVLVLAVRAGRDDAVRELLERGANPDIRGADGLTALGTAAYLGQPAIMHRLLQAGADVDLAGNNGYSPVQLACMTGKVAAIDELLKAGADLQQPDRRGRHALGVAANFGQIPAMARLVAAGFDPATPDDRQLNAQQRAVEGGQLDALNWLREHRAAR